MTQQAKELVKSNPNAKYNTYTFSYVGDDAGTGEDNKKKGPIFSAATLTDDVINKQKLVSNTNNTSAQTDETNDRPANPTVTTITVSPGTPVLQAFENIIVNSSYILDAFKVIKTNADTANSDNPDKQQDKVQDSKAKIKWYNVSAQCTKAEFDDLTQDWVWNINYVFQVYETPMVDNPYSNLGVAYYGPHKRYNFW